MVATRSNIKSNANQSHPTTTACYHCGEACQEEVVTIQEKSFCCEGCKMVYEVLNTNNLDYFYKITDKPGVTFKKRDKEEYAFLDDPIIVAQLIDFENEKITKATFSIPQIHCASCIWLLENLYQLDERIIQARVNFLKKEGYITYSSSTISYREVVELLASLGYSPAINLGSLDAVPKVAIDKRFYYQLGVAGFAFGNIMLLSLPDYLGLKDVAFKELFGWLNILLILPVVFYSSRDYWTSAWHGIRQNRLNIDVPISLGIFTLFFRSLFEIITQTGVGYLDSLAGLVFFLLIGKWFQQKTYNQLSFERDYKSYFPIATTVLKQGKTTSVALSQLQIGDVVVLKQGELIPTDGILISDTASIDYSFVTGESEPVRKQKGEKLYAGGRQLTGAIQVRIIKKIAQSYLMQLWNEEAFQKENTHSIVSRTANRIGQYFTYIILFIAFATLAYWLPKDLPTAINAFTAVLIIACPCAIALSIPFTLGNALRLFSRMGLYLKNTQVIEQLNDLNAIVFDKTGTVTIAKDIQLTYKGTTLSEQERQAVLQLTQQSNHPISQQIVQYLQQKSGFKVTTNLAANNIKSIVGKGIYGTIGGLEVGIEKGTMSFAKNDEASESYSGTIIQINGRTKGIFIHQNKYREGFQQVIQQWQSFYNLYLLSGDNDKERSILEKYLPTTHLFFGQAPIDKLNFIKNQQQEGGKVLMLGDGLNDSGALQQADVGIVIAENTNNFTPACDAILDARQFHQLPTLLQFAKRSLNVVYASYGLAFIYNIIGLKFAITGTLSPVIAAILMPLSSITIVLFGVGMTYLLKPKI